MAQKNKDSLNENVDFYTSYFKEELDAIEEELEKSKKYSTIIDKEIDKLSAPSLGSNKGTQHYLIEHINNAVQLQTQRQGLRKDKFTVKKAILDYAAKFAEEEVSNNNETSIEKTIEKLIELDRKNRKENEVLAPQPNIDLDAEIDKALNGEG